MFRPRSCLDAEQPAAVAVESFVGSPPSNGVVLRGGCRSGKKIPDCMKDILEYSEYDDDWDDDEEDVDDDWDDDEEDDDDYDDLHWD